jgi:hypothetical protein
VGSEELDWCRSDDSADRAAAFASSSRSWVASKEEVEDEAEDEADGPAARRRRRGSASAATNADSAQRSRTAGTAPTDRGLRLNETSKAWAGEAHHPELPSRRTPRAAAAEGRPNAAPVVDDDDDADGEKEPQSHRLRFMFSQIEGQRVPIAVEGRKDFAQKGAETQEQLLL